MKARINRVKYYRCKLYWWWKIRHYEMDPEKVTNFWEWLNLQDMYLARYELRGNTFEDHEHVLVELGMEETEAILERYLQWKVNRSQVNKGLSEPL